MIGSLALSGGNENIVKLLENLKANIENVGSHFICDNKIVNAVLAGKEQEAEKLGIKCNFKVADDFSVDFVSQEDLITILANLIENAVEAASGLPEGAGWIEVKLYMTEGGRFAWIHIRNSCRSDAGNYGIGKSSKKEKRGHGYGLKGVEKLAHKYGGFFECGCSEEVFQVRLLLSRDKEIQKPT